MPGWTDALDIFRLATFVQADTGPSGGWADGMYLCGTTPDNERSVLMRGLEFYRQGGRARNILLGEGGPNGTPYFPPNATADTPMAYSGSEAWRMWLIDKGVSANDIMEHLCPALSHTGTDAASFVRHAKENGWRTAYVIAWPVHLSRVFVLCVSRLLREYPELRLYAGAGTPLPWLEEVVASQGDVRGNRLEGLMQAEFDRLNRAYGNEYDPVSPAEVFNYIRWRDESS